MRVQHLDVAIIVAVVVVVLINVGLAMLIFRACH
jgi:hypothetical protein